MQEHIGLLIAAARRRIKQAVGARLRGHRLTAQQFWLLIALRERAPRSQALLAEMIRSDAPTVSRTISALVERRLVRAHEDPADRRRAQVTLTAAGTSLAAKLAPIAAEIRSAVVKDMTAREIDALRLGLLRVIDNLDALEAREPTRESA